MHYKWRNGLSVFLWGHFASQWNVVREKVMKVLSWVSWSNISARLMSSYSEPCLDGNFALCGKAGSVWVTQEFSISKKHFFCGQFCLGCLFPFYINKLTLTDPHCVEPFIAREEKPYLKWHWNSSERFGVWAQRKPCTCMFIALSLAKVRHPLLDKCKAFSALSTSYWPILVQ